MSRTIKKTKGPGYEYWSRPKTSKELRDPSRWTKKETVRRARRKDKQKVSQRTPNEDKDVNHPADNS